MFVSNFRDAEPFMAADLSEIRCLVDRANTGSPSVSLAHATVALGAETVWHRLEATDEIYFVLSGRGLVSVGRRISGGGARRCRLDTGRYSARIRNLGPDPLEFLCACGPAYLRECDQRAGAVADRSRAVTTVGDHLVNRMREAGISVLCGLPTSRLDSLLVRISPHAGFRVVLTRHEGGAGYLADGFAQERPARRLRSLRRDQGRRTS